MIFLPLAKYNISLIQTTVIKENIYRNTSSFLLQLKLVMKQHYISGSLFASLHFIHLTGTAKNILLPIPTANLRTYRLVDRLWCHKAFVNATLGESISFVDGRVLFVCGRPFHKTSLRLSCFLLKDVMELFFTNSLFSPLPFSNFFFWNSLSQAIRSLKGKGELLFLLIFFLLLLEHLLNGVVQL